MRNKKWNNVALAIVMAMVLSSCKVGRFVYYNFADIKDYKKFPSRAVVSNDTKFKFHRTDKGKYPQSLKTDKERVSLEQLLEDNNTVAFLIIKNDTIQYEKYFNGYDQESVIPSFSMAKSITSILIGCAIDDGLIKSVDEPVTNYIPELARNGFEKVSIKHLLQMTSALDFSESYINPFGEAASFYYGRNLKREMFKLELKGEPGKKFEYVSGNTQLLGLVLERALKNKTVTQYFQEKLWTPLQMEYDGSWSIDKKNEGTEKTFCCINARARDFAKIGRLYLNKGNWNGKQLVSEKWVRESTKIDTTEGGVDYYKYQWWLPSTTGDFMAEGILGQYIYVDPSKNIVIVRMGKNNGHVNWSDFFMLLAKYPEK
ncbi:serine hydrolase [Flavobacterium sp. MAH-1]|uniref:Serine hydrolase n=1 Tax=Flavobacterium agri TaxID=2743471 RepID=A0A7Y9C8I0_9FLAO|nr:serine hydrolase [Flavobacterium agri]NUY82474.1 serine hydrolase [Flavobacterium agri]NYA72498.1 serine hydrolase [Flavobacterium agri]